MPPRRKANVPISPCSPWGDSLHRPKLQVPLPSALVLPAVNSLSVPSDAARPAKNTPSSISVR